MEFKAQTLELKADDAGGFEGYGAFFDNVDSDNDKIERGAFSKSLTARKPKMLWQHDPRDPIGVFDSVKEDGRGLYVKGRFANTLKAQEARDLVKMGAVDSMSIGYRTKQFLWDGDVRVIKEVDLFEVSLVTIPANEQARLVSVKSLDTAREVEDALRQIGFSQKQAMAFISGGWGSVKSLRDAGEVDPDLTQRDVAGVKSQLETLLKRIGQ